MSHDLTAGKLRGLMSLASDGGTFEMIAVDQRPPIFRALARHGGRRPDEVRYDEVAAVKTLLTRVLAPDASAVLLDPVWTHPHALTHVPGRVGLLSTLEGYDFALVDGERRSHPIRHWSVAKIRRAGAQGVKVLAWHRPDVGPDTAAHQDAFVAAIGDACREHDLPYVLELLIYPFEGEDPDGADYARAKPRRVLESVRHFADERFGIDLLKLEFPADLKRTREFATGAFDGVARASVYDLDAVRGFLAELHDATHVPWVLLSAGVGPEEFATNLSLAFEAGASGFLAGRAVWLDALDAYPDLEAVEERLRRRSRPYLHRIAGLSRTAVPWQRHPRFGGEVALAGAALDWLEGYGA